MENTVESLRGVISVKARLKGESQGEAEIIYNPAEITLEDLNGAIPLAGGQNHKFKVISVVEGG